MIIGQLIKEGHYIPYIIDKNNTIAKTTAYLLPNNV